MIVHIFSRAKFLLNQQGTITVICVLVINQGDQKRSKNIDALFFLRSLRDFQPHISPILLLKVLEGIGGLVEGVLMYFSPKHSPGYGYC